GGEGGEWGGVGGNWKAKREKGVGLAAVHGQGLALAPSFLLIDEIKSGRLVPVLTEFLQAEHAINAIYPHRHHLSAKVRSFIDLLVKHFHEDPGWADPGGSPLAAEPPLGVTVVADAPSVGGLEVAADDVAPQHHLRTGGPHPPFSGFSPPSPFP